MVHFSANQKSSSAAQATEKAALELGIKSNVPVGEGTP